MLVLANYLGFLRAEFQHKNFWTRINLWAAAFFQ